jgi:beta propeller repeat protein
MSVVKLGKFGFIGSFIVATLTIFSFVQPISAAEEIPIVLNAATQRYPAVDGNRVVWSDNRNGNWDI